MRHNFRDLTIWKDSLALAKESYMLTSQLPTEEKYGLCSQLNRCAVSIPSNIAEGFGRYHYQENIQACRIARGSLYELDTQLILSRELGLTKDEKLISQLENEIAELGKMINALLIKLK